MSTTSQIGAEGTGRLARLGGVRRQQTMSRLTVSCLASCLPLLGCGADAAARPAPSSVSPSVPGQRCVEQVGLPDPTCTPGAVTTAVTQDNIRSTVCVAGYTSRVRPPVSFTDALKRRQLTDYGLSGGRAAYEEDHLVPLNIGGAPDDPRNLWPEPRTGPKGSTAADKDDVEFAVYQRVCAGRLSLAAARSAMANDWRTAARLPDDLHR